MIERLAIVGLGLMGGSLGLAARERAGVAHVVGCDPDPAACEAALVARVRATRPAASSRRRSRAPSSSSCARPWPSCRARSRSSPSSQPDATVTDIGSTKVGVVAAVPAGLRHRFIGGHPICGMETRGAQNARAELFEGATWYLTPLTESEPERLRDLHRLLAALGATPVAIDAGRRTTACSRSRATCRTRSRTCSSCRRARRASTATTRSPRSAAPSAT